LRPVPPRGMDATYPGRSLIAAIGSRCPGAGAPGAIHQVLTRFCASRRRDLRSRPDHRPRETRKRTKAASRKSRGAYGHTPLSIAEDIPRRCRRLVIGTGADGALPVMDQVQDEARRRKIDLVVLPTAEAIGVLTGAAQGTNAVLHVTC
jgi:hypothetical protein